ncbi:phosphoglycerate mutase family protein [Dendryphion nanum]|uniref:Phosphoglycerate mutase family protein n=1 Tax=Dendryphion nanum TaxID=256645 RepID=A0A9P9E365_9PLEO|nr:phosphoglycerate mutase family protein [Dendryphion nanum]
MGKPGHFEYTTIKGYFLQSEEDTDDLKFDFRKQNFGLIDRKYETDEEESGEIKALWSRFHRYVQKLNETSEKDEHYKVLFLGRHGQGYHNVAESKYGTPAWDCYWSMLDGADGVIWADANLTELGQDQARDVYQLWKTQLPKGIPAPESYYVSPLVRAIETADLSFKDADIPSSRPYKPLVKELLREAIGVHTCDRRSTASQIQKRFPHLRFEDGFSEQDPLWAADYREPGSARKYRLGLLLDDVFAHDDGLFLSFTSHSGAIRSILKSIGHREFMLETGGVIPVLVKAKKVDGERKMPPHEPSKGPPKCTEPPKPSELSH